MNRSPVLAISSPQPCTSLSPGSRRFSYHAPSSSDDEDDFNTAALVNKTASFSLQAPHGDTDSDEEDDACSLPALQTRRRRSSSSFRPASAFEVALAETTAKLGQHLQLKAHRRVSGFQRELLEIETQERMAAQLAAQQWQEEFNALAATDREMEARKAQEREQLLISLRTAHQQQADQAAKTIQEALKKEEEARAKAAKEEEEAARAAARAKEEQAAKDQEAEQKKKIPPKPLVEPKEEQNRSGILSIAPSASQFSRRCSDHLAAAKSTVKPFVEDRAMRDIKRSIDKFITLNVQQISATLEQVKQKAQALVGFISQHHDIQRTYALVTLAGKLMSQCEVQITRLHSFAFPLAEVAVAVASAHPDFIDLLLARMHDACPLAVPMYYGFRSGGDDLEYLELMKYKISEDEKESTDDYMGRMQGYVMLYAAITQSDNPSNPHGLQHGWEYLARLLNVLPANRLTAAALDAFLKIAGYKMAAVYKGQFRKLLMAVDRDFIAELAQTNDPDARAVCTRLQTYLKMQQFTKVPEGRNMPQYDASSYDRA